jgi:hypothetical protein
VVETIRLESGHTLTGIGGSNPSLSAITRHSFWLHLLSIFLRPSLLSRTEALLIKQIKFSCIPVSRSHGYTGKASEAGSSLNNHIRPSLRLNLGAFSYVCTTPSKSEA